MPPHFVRDLSCCVWDPCPLNERLLLSLSFRWEVDDWGACSRTCGGGVRTRNVVCVIDRDARKVKVRLHRIFSKVPRIIHRRGLKVGLQVW